jgi:hypothetical protein
MKRTKERRPDLLGITGKTNTKKKQQNK